MKNDLPRAAMPADPDNLPEQLALPFSAGRKRSRLPPPRTEIDNDGYFVDTRRIRIGNGLSYCLRVCQDRRTGEILSYRLMRVTASATHPPAGTSH